MVTPLFIAVEFTGQEEEPRKENKMWHIHTADNEAIKGDAFICYSRGEQGDIMLSEANPQ